MQLSLVHPCYNEEPNIERTVRESLRWMDDQEIDGEVIVVDDGSADRSASILRTLRQGDGRVKVITRAENGGYGAAVRDGCDAAEKEYTAFMDSDGQFHVDDLRFLIEHMNFSDVVIGRRRKRADSFLRNIFGKILGALVLCTFGLWIRDVNCGMKMFKTSLWLIARPRYGTEKFFNTELLLRLRRAGVSWKQVDVPHYPRAGGRATGGSPRVIVGMIRELWRLRIHLSAEMQRTMAISSESEVICGFSGSRRSGTSSKSGRST